MKLHAQLASVAGLVLSSFMFGAFTAGAMLQDPAKLAPETYKVLLDNDRLRVIDYHLQPGQKEPVHSHPAGAFVYFLTDASTRAAGSQAKSSKEYKKAGDYIWRDPVTHAGENTGKTEIHALLIEPKNFCK